MSAEDLCKFVLPRRGKNEEMEVHTFDYTWKHHRALISNLNKQRLENVLCDVTLNVSGTRINAHRCVLAGCSSYFSTMFCTDMAERNEKVITILDVTAKAMEIVVEFFYTSRLKDINFDNVSELMAASSLLMIKHIFEHCVVFLSTNVTDPGNCLETFYLADLYSLADVKAAASETIRQYFAEVVATPDFLLMSNTLLTEIISEDNLHCEKEEEVFNAVKRWIEYDNINRKPYLPDLLNHVRLRLIETEFLTKNVLPFCHGDNKCCNLVAAAMKQLTPMLNSRFTYDLLFAADQNICWTREGFNLSPVGEWKQLPDFPESSKFKGSFDITVLDGTVYLLALTYNSAYRRQLLAYTHKTKAWTFGPVLPSDLGFFDSLVASSGYIYVLGSNFFANDVKEAILMRFDPNTKDLVQLASLFSDHHRSVALCAIHNKLYSVGSGSVGYEQDDVFSYDTIANKWEKMPNKVIQQEHHTAGVFQGKLIIAGGTDLGGNPANTEIFDPGTQVWTVGPQLSIQRHNASLIESGKRLYIVCGVEKNEKEVEEYDPVQETWRPCGSTSLPRAGLIRLVSVLKGNSTNIANSRYLIRS